MTGVTLGIDCCLRKTSVGCAKDDAVLGEVHLDIGRNQASFLPAVVDGLLRALELSLADVDLVAVTTGPGYFTGVRVGVAYACALAEGLGVSVAPVSTLEALALPVLYGEHVCVPVVWGKRGFGFSAGYGPGVGGQPETVLPPAFLGEEDMRRRLEALGKNVLLVGEDAPKFPCLDAFPRESAVGSFVRGGAVALLGVRRPSLIVKPSHVRAEYLREPDIGKPGGVRAADASIHAGK